MVESDSNLSSSQVYLVSRHIPDRTQRWLGVPFLQYNNKKCFIKFLAINKTEVQKIEVEVEVSGYGLIRGRTSAQIKTLRPCFLTLSTTRSYQSIRFFCFGVFFSSANCILIIWVLEYDFVQQIPGSSLKNVLPH